MNDDDLLRAALTDAVSDIEPTDRLGEIRRANEAPARRRRWWAASGASLLVTASAVTILVATRGGDGPGAIGPGAIGPGASASVATPSEQPTTVSAIPAYLYFLGPGPSGPDAPASRLYLSVGAGLDLLTPLTRPPSDPDYRTLWAPGSFAGFQKVTVDGQTLIVVKLTGVGRQRPAGVTDEEARLSIQQVVYTVQGFSDESVPVLFEEPEGGDLDEVWGISVGADGLARRAPELDVLNQMSITEPEEGSTYSRELDATGRSDGFEAGVYCQLLAADGTQVWDGVTTAEGWTEPRLYPWEMRVDLTGLEPGTYSFECTTDDPTGGTEGYGASTDTRTVTVE